MVGIIPAWVHQPVKSVLSPPVGNQQHHDGSDRKAEHQKQESDRKFTHGHCILQYNKDRANPLPEKTKPLTLGLWCNFQAFWNTNTTFYRICGRQFGPGEFRSPVPGAGTLRDSLGTAQKPPRAASGLHEDPFPGPPPNRTKNAPAASGLLPAASEPFEGHAHHLLDRCRG